MAEYIEREAALALAKDICVLTKWDAEYRHRSIDPLDVMELPAADVRPVVRGKWISDDDGKTVVRMKNGEPQNSCNCSVCGEWLVASDEYYVKGNFCPNCGVDMRSNDSNTLNALEDGES